MTTTLLTISMKLTFLDFTCEWDYAVFVFLYLPCLLQIMSSGDLSGGTSDKESTCNTGDTKGVGSISGWGRSPEGGNGNPLQYSCLGNLMDRRAWWATVDGVSMSWIQLCSDWAQYPPDSPMLLQNTGLPSFLNYRYRYRYITIYLFIHSVHFSSFQFSHSVMSDSLWPHARPPCPSPTPGVYSNSCPFSWSCHPAISSSVIPFSSCPQSFPESGSFQMSQLSASGSQSIGVSASASVPPMNTQDWSLGWTGWISLKSKRLSRVFSNTTVQKHQFFCTQISL